MRVIFLTHNYPRRPGDLPGGFLHPLALALRDAGVDLRVVAPADRGRGGRETLDGIPVHRVRYAPAAWETLAYTGRMQAALRDPRGLLALAGMWRALRRGARREALGAADTTVVHAHWWFPSGAAAPPELPLVVTLHGTDGRLLQRGGLARSLGRRTLRKAAVVTTVSHALAATVEAETGKAIPRHAIQGMPVEAARWQRSTGGGGIVSVARLTPQKRLGLLIEAAALLRARGHLHRLTLVGEGEERGRLEDLVGSGDMTEWVRLPGARSTDEVAALLARADLFVLPSHDEGYGLAAAEALLCGVPVVACADGGGLLDLVPAGGPGRIVPPTPEGIADGMAELLGSPSASAEAWQMGQQLREALAPAAVAARALEWYRLALASRR